MNKQNKIGKIEEVTDIETDELAREYTRTFLEEIEREKEIEFIKETQEELKRQEQFVKEIEAESQAIVNRTVEKIQSMSLEEAKAEIDRLIKSISS